MSTRVLMAAITAAALGFALEPGTALANKPAYSISGAVTTPPVGQQITVNGQTYQIQPGSSAAQQVNQVVEGESVELILNGPPGSSSSEVVAIDETTSN